MTNSSLCPVSNDDHLMACRRYSFPLSYVEETIRYAKFNRKSDTKNQWYIFSHFIKI